MLKVPKLPGAMEKAKTDFVPKRLSGLKTMKMGRVSDP